MKILMWITEKVKDYGIKKVSLVVGVIIVIAYIFSKLWGIEKDVVIRPYAITDQSLSEDVRIEVTRTGKISDGYSLASVTTELLSGVSSEVELISTFNDLQEVSEQVRTKKETLIIPSGAGWCSMGEIKLYMWTRTGKHFLTEQEFSEIHMVVLCDGSYMSVSMDSNLANIAFGVSIETGTY